MTIASRLSARIPPDAALANVAHRALLGVCVPGLAGHRGTTSGALARALATTGLGRFSPDEALWIRRIEARRTRLAREHAASHGISEAWTPPRVWSIPRVWGRLLLRLVRELAPRSCIELGAGFGISALYQSAALEISGSGTLVTLDQETSLMPFVNAGFTELGLEGRAELVPGPIGETLDSVAQRRAPIDYAFIDAEHTESATVSNFDRLRPHLSDRAVVVVDDIRTSHEMRRAWEAIRARPGILDVHDVRRLGIVVVGA